MRRVPILFLSLVCGAGACSPDQAAPQPPAPAVPAKDPLGDVVKNGGKPWSVDEHTKKHIDAMVAAVQGKAADPSAAATEALGKELRRISGELLQGCTMQGPAHFALHGYLAVLFADMDAMVGQDPAKAQAARTEAAAILARFGEFFQ
jgi:hypothetical protein